MKYWTRYMDKWFDASSIAFADYEFDIMKRELLVGFDKLTEEFDRIFNDDPNELDFSESYVGVRSETVREEVSILLYGSYPLNRRHDKNARVRKIRRNVKPDGSVTGSNIPLSRIENEGRRKSLDDVIVTDENIKVVSQLPLNNRRETIKVVAHSDNSVTISHLSSEGKRCRRTSVIPYNIDIDAARSTYRNGILEITFNRK
jgi:HSP20 family protein